METLKRALEIMGRDTGMIPLPPNQWPKDKRINYKMLEMQCKKLSAEELETFVCGEMEEMIKIRNTHKLNHLSKFLGRAFDGDLTEFFFWTI